MLRLRIGSRNSATLNSECQARLGGECCEPLSRGKETEMGSGLHRQQLAEFLSELARAEGALPKEGADDGCERNRAIRLPELF